MPIAMINRIICFAASLLLLVGCEPKGSPSNPVDLPEEAVGELKGTAGVPDGGEAFADIYNGTKWTVVDVDLTVTKVPTGESRRVRLACIKEVKEAVIGRAFDRTKEVTTELLPYSSGKFKGTSGDFLDGLKKEDKSYSIVGARGYTK